jgi:intracellular sulfur oxidation DsrE/DsrF family protein
MKSFKNQLVILLTPILAAGMLMTVAGSSVAGDKKMHKLVIQVSSSDPLTQKIALNNAVNVQKELGIDNIKIEIVAFGPGLGLLTTSKKNKQAKRVKSLAMQNITFSACGNTIKKMTKKNKGKKPTLIEGVNVVTAGVSRIITLQEEGYSYIRP